MTLAPPSRREETLRRFAELAETARAWVDSHPPGAAADTPVGPLVRAVEAAETQARLGDIAPATRALESLVPDLVRRAERDGLDLETARPRARAIVQRTLASATLAEAYRISGEHARSERLRAALDAFSKGESALARHDDTQAADSFRRASALLETILRDQTLSALEERLRALRQQRSRLVEELRRLPAQGFPERQREDAIGVMRRLDRALEGGDEQRAKSMLAECEALLHDPTAAAAATPVVPRREDPPRRRPGVSWGLAVAFLVGAVSIAIGLGLWDPDPGALLGRTGSADTPTEEPPVPAAHPDEMDTGTPSSERVSSAPQNGFSARSQPAERSGVSPRSVGAGPRTATALAPHARRLARIREASAAHAGTAVPITPGGPELRSSSPAEVSLTLAAGERQRFEAAVTGDRRRLRWELDGAAIGRGPGVDLPELSPGTHWLALVAGSGETRRLLRAWQLWVTPDESGATTIAAAGGGEKDTEILLWIDTWCSAFERKDLNALAALGEVRGPDHAAEIAQTLSAMTALRVSCATPEISVDGDRATVRFVRIDRWSDLTAARFETVHPPVERRLHREDGRWVVTAEKTSADKALPDPD